MKNRPNKVMRASKKKPNRPKADDPRQDLRSKASIKCGIWEVGERAWPNRGGRIPPGRIGFWQPFVFPMSFFDFFCYFVF